MRPETLDIMVCPDCKSDFKVKEAYKKKKDRIIAGIIACKCCEYPILDGILIYEKPDITKNIYNTKYLMELLKTKKGDAACALPLEGEKIDNGLYHLYLLFKSTGIFNRALNPSLSLIRYLKKKRYNEYFGRNLTFFDLMSQLKPDTWGDYLKHRFSSESLWSFYPFIPILRKKNDMILDLGCGVGHVAYLVSKHTRPKKLVCADQDYTLLQIAKRYFAPDAEFICFNLNNSLPFKDQLFSSIIMLDSFHYVGNRARLANDLERVIRSDGLLLIPHLHNSQKETISRAFALEPSAWESLFQKLKVKSIPEKDLINGLMNENKLQLNKEYTYDELNKSIAITLIGTNDQKLFATYENIHKSISDSPQNLIINPIYSLKKVDRGIRLIRKVPNELFRTEYPQSMRYLPERIDLDNMVVNILEGRNLRLPSKITKDMQNKIENLIRNFIIIDAPKNYI